MEGQYISFICKRCHKETILITEEAQTTIRNGNYLSCSHCGCKNLIRGKVTDDLRECMNHSAYKKVNGAFRQVRDG